MPHDLRRLVVHGDGAFGVAQRDPRRKIGVLGQQGGKHGLIAVQDRIHQRMLGHGLGKTGNYGCRPTIATHGVNGNDKALGGEFGGRGGR